MSEPHNSDGYFFKSGFHGFIIFQIVIFHTDSMVFFIFQIVIFYMDVTDLSYFRQLFFENRFHGFIIHVFQIIIFRMDSHAMDLSYFR